MLMGLGHQFYGINGIDNGGGSTYGTIRFGFGANNEMNYAWYGRFGIGADSRSVFWNSPVDDCGSCGCYGSPGDPEFYAANLWVR
jgi:hypothetical protein